MLLETPVYYISRVGVGGSYAIGEQSDMMRASSIALTGLGRPHALRAPLL